jgi:hypothetical protein
MLRDLCNRSEVLKKLSKFGALDIKGGQSISSHNRQLVVSEHIDPNGPGRILYCWYIVCDHVALLRPCAPSLCADAVYLLPHQIGERVEFTCSGDGVFLQGKEEEFSLRVVYS